MKNLYSKISEFSDYFSKSELGKIEKITNDNARLIDVLYNFPSRYIKFSETQEVSNGLLNTDITIQLRVINHIKSNYFGKGRNTPYKINCQTKDGEQILIIFFKPLKNYVSKFEIDKVVKIRGKLNLYKKDFMIAHPSLIKVTDDFQKIDESENINILSRYRTTNGIKSSDTKIIILNCIRILEEKSINFINELPIDSNSDFLSSIKEIHNPTSEEKLELAMKRFIFEEFFANGFAMHHARISDEKEIGISFQKSNNLSNLVLKNFKYELTNDQKSALNEIEYNQLKEEKMLRLLQGDVGSGKTIVALLSACNVIEQNYKVVLLAPTTILATQHFHLTEKLFYGSNTRIELITSKTPVAKKRKIYNDYQNNEIDILIGTHSVFNENLINNKIGLIIIDEQHRFGVEQRLLLIEKSKHADVLMMSATPIPRTLAMTMYGDIEVSIIKEKPSFQKQIKTSIISAEKYQELVEHIKKRLKSDERCYWICPLIESEDEEESSVNQRYSVLKNCINPELISTLTGRMKEDEKNTIIQKFQTGETKILISTTVVEVGVNVPDATIMVIESAEKFGLSQLHQLRGRVGRGDKESFCILMYGEGANDLSIERLKIIKENSDGFEISKHDMKIRGFGKMLGIEQSGDCGYKIANVYRDYEIMQKAFQFAKDCLQNPDLIDVKMNHNEFVNHSLMTYFPNDYTRYVMG